MRKEVDEEMREGDAREQTSNIIQWQGETLDSLVRMYLSGMRVGVETNDEALVGCVMEGVGKFGELVNVDVVSEVVRVCKRLLMEDELRMSTASSLACIKCVYELLHHNLEETNKDDLWLLTALYKHLANVTEAGDTLLSCVDNAVFKRREIRVTTVSALVKRLLTVAIGSSDTMTQSTLLGLARMVISRYKTAERGTEEEEGSGEVYDGLVDDPEFSNIHGDGGAFWEFGLLKYAHNAEVRKSAGDGASLKRLDATSDPRKAKERWQRRQKNFRHKMKEQPNGSARAFAKKRRMNPFVKNDKNEGDGRESVKIT